MSWTVWELGHCRPTEVAVWWPTPGWIAVGEDGDSLPGVVGPTGNAPVPNWYGEVRSNSIIQRSYQDGRKRRDCCLISRELAARTERTLQVALVENEVFFFWTGLCFCSSSMSYRDTNREEVPHLLCSSTNVSRTVPGRLASRARTLLRMQPLKAIRESRWYYERRNFTQCVPFYLRNQPSRILDRITTRSIK